MRSPVGGVTPGVCSQNEQKLMRKRPLFRGMPDDDDVEEEHGQLTQWCGRGVCNYG